MTHPDEHDGPEQVDDGVNFQLSRKEPARDLLWMAGSFGFVLLLAWYGGKVDGTYFLVFLGLFSLMYVFTWMDESKADEDRSVKLRIARDGIAIPDKFSGAIAWDDIEKLMTHTHKSSTTLHIVPREDASRPVPVNEGWRRWLVGKGIDYHVTPLEGDVDDIIAAIRRYGPNRLSDGL